MVSEARVIKLLKMRTLRVGGAKAWSEKNNIPYGTTQRVLAGAIAPTQPILNIMGLERVYRYMKPDKKPPQGKYGTIYGDADE
jgi:hypothetical protein